MSFAVGVSLPRLSTVIGKAISAYAILGKDPKLVADFDGEYYRANGGKTTFSNLITHARAGNATMTDSDGLIKWAPHNLLTYSEDLSNWSNAWAGGVTLTSNASTAPDGTTTADRIAQADAASDGIFISFTPTSSVLHTANVFLKAGTAARSGIFLYEVAGGTNSATLSITWTSGVPSTFSSVDATDITYTSVGDGWYLVSFKFISDSGSHRFVIQPSTDSVNTNYIDVWGAHLYRSDLGGMVDNPDRGDSYVPTTSSAVYLPRRGHHVYNGYEWVNEGVLAESEARTNLAPYSDMSSASLIGATYTANAAISPDGNQNAFELTSTTTAPSYIRYSGLFTSGQSYAVSIYAKAGTNDIIRIANASSTTSGQWFDLTNGALLTNNGVGNTATIEDVGNGWYRCTRYFDSVTAPSSDEIFVANSSGDGQTGAISGSTIYLYGFQIENNATSSSYIPTSGSSVTRAAETFTIPSAKLPWPSPVYIGDELVTNGTFDTDVSGWSDNSIGTGTAVWSSGAALIERVDVSNQGKLTQSITTVSNSVYVMDLTATVISGSPNPTVNVGTTSGGFDIGNFQNQSRIFFVASSATTYITLQNSSLGTTSFDNISIREINPLSVSIQMDGKISYTKSGSDTFCRWFKDANTYINDVFFSDYKFISAQKDGTTYDQVATDVYFSGDLLEPYSIASRHGSTFINGAVDGVALTANTTPVALPDLSSTDLDLAYDYMGTIKTFRIWDKDLGDTGLVAATAPSLEPSLSLSFDSTESSFIDKGWSE